MEISLKEAKYQLGLNVFNFRDARDWTQSELATRADLSSKYISRLENGNENVRLDTLVKLSNAFGIPLSMLFTFDEEQSVRIGEQ